MFFSYIPTEELLETGRTIEVLYFIPESSLIKDSPLILGDVVHLMPLFLVWLELGGMLANTSTVSPFNWLEMFIKFSIYDDD